MQGNCVPICRAVQSSRVGHSGDKRDLIAVEGPVEASQIVELCIRSFPAVQKRSLAAVKAPRKVKEHQGNVAANQVTLPALTPVAVGHSAGPAWTWLVHAQRTITTRGCTHL